MDGGHFVPTSSIRATPVSPLAVRLAKPANMFLRRDLSEQALQPPTLPAITSQDVAAAREQGFEAGHASALAEAAASRATAEGAALGEIATAMTCTQEDAEKIADEAAGALSRALIAAMSAVMPDLIERSALGELSAMLARVMPGLSHEPKIHVHAPPALQDGLLSILDKLEPAHRVRIEMNELPDMDAGSLRVRWRSGEARREPAQIWREVMDALEAALPRTKELEHGE